MDTRKHTVMRRDVLPVLHLLGMFTMGFALIMLIPAELARQLGEGVWRTHLLSAGITFICGALMWLSTGRWQRDLQARHGVLLVVLTWSVLPLLATLPLLLGFEYIGRELDFTRAYYEAASGLTTTGGTVLSQLDTLPVSINFWRCLLQWMGGMGILILVVAVLPFLGMGGSQLFRAESPGPMKETKLTPRIAETAKGLWSVYATLSVVCALGYWAAGMEPLDAVMHMFSTVSLGGMSSHDASFSYFNSARIEAVCIAVMLVASCNFALYFSAVYKRRPSIIWRNPELKLSLLTLVGGSLVVALVLWIQGAEAPLHALRMAFFNTISVATTTGFVTADYERWPGFAPVFMLLLSSFATSAGSTGGGIKTIRCMVLVQQAKQELRRIVHPHAIQPATIAGARIPDHIVRAVVAYFVLYGGTVLVMVLLLLGSGLDLISAFTSTLASINCVGPGLSATGPSTNYAALSDFQIWVCSAGMILGRLELLSFFALLTPTYWRR